MAVNEYAPTFQLERKNGYLGNLSARVMGTLMTLWTRRNVKILELEHFAWPSSFCPYPSFPLVYLT